MVVALRHKKLSRRRIATTPAHDAGTVDIVITTFGGTVTLQNAFTYY